MPKKLNFLGGQQNYDADNGQYLPELKGPNGETLSGFQSFKKPKSEFEKNNEKRLGKKKGNDEEKEEYNDVNDYEISEVLADYEWQITPETTAGQYAEACAKHLGTSKEKVFNVIKQQAPDKITEDSKMADLIKEWEEVEDDETEEKEKSLDEYTDDLFKAAKVTTFTSKKYKNDKGEIVEIRRFGEGKNAIRYNETKKEVEQVWIDGERVK